MESSYSVSVSLPESLSCVSVCLSISVCHYEHETFTEYSCFLGVEGWREDSVELLCWWCVELPFQTFLTIRGVTNSIFWGTEDWGLSHLYFTFLRLHSSPRGTFRLVVTSCGPALSPSSRESHRKRIFCSIIPSSVMQSPVGAWDSMRAHSSNLGHPFASTGNTHSDGHVTKMQKAFKHLAGIYIFKKRTWQVCEWEISCLNFFFWSM